jgi:hypothetical protein
MTLANDMYKMSDICTHIIKQTVIEVKIMNSLIVFPSLGTNPVIQSNRSYIDQNPSSRVRALMLKMPQGRNKESVASFRTRDELD